MKQLESNTQQGFAHLFLVLILAVVVLGIGGIGAYVMGKSSAGSQITCKLVDHNTPRRGSTFYAKFRYYNGSGSYWTGNTNPRLAVYANSNYTSLLKTVTGTQVSGIAPGQYKTGTVSTTLPSNSKSLKAYDSTGLCSTLNIVY